MLFQTGGLKMKLNYYAETDSLYIDLSEQASAETVEISQGVKIDFASSGEIVGIDIDNASKVLNLKELNINNLPARVVVAN